MFRHFAGSTFCMLALLVVGEAVRLAADEALQLGIVNSIQKVLQPSAPPPNAQYDFIVVGAGAAGCALANRLTENPNWTVMLLEAGGFENYFHQVPLTALALQTTHSNWNYKSVPQNNACLGMYRRQCALPRGKILGGSSSINLMIYNRGNRRDFDNWAAAGADGWSYADVLPYFLKSERANLVGLEQSPYHNHSGPLSVEYVRYRTQFAHTFVQASQQAGYRLNDYNGESQLGVSYVQATTRDGRRHSGYAAYIDPIRHRRNLHILPFSRVTRVLIDPATKSAYGVELLYRRKLRRIKARKEVILSAGTFNSPQLLMLSGIGPEDNLRAIDVPLIQELPVGERMYDHMTFGGLVFVTNTTGQTITMEELRADDVLRFALQRDASTVLSTLGGMEALAFLQSPAAQNDSSSSGVPDIELILMAGSFASASSNEFIRSANIKNVIYERIYAPLVANRREHFTLVPVNLRPKSVGRLWLQTRNPLDWPIIDPNYLSADEDVESILAGIKAAIRITQMPAMQSICARLWNVPLPGCEEHTFGTDAYWRCAIRTFSYTLHHQVATCRMGAASDATTVVNGQLKVHGVRKLRVVDTSIVPFAPSAHTNAMAFMIGEKAADLIRGDWGDCTLSGQCTPPQQQQHQFTQSTDNSDITVQAANHTKSTSSPQPCR